MNTEIPRQNRKLDIAHFVVVGLNLIFFYLKLNAALTFIPTLALALLLGAIWAWVVVGLGAALESKQGFWLHLLTPFFAALFSNWLVVNSVPLGSAHEGLRLVISLFHGLELASFCLVMATFRLLRSWKVR